MLDADLNPNASILQKPQSWIGKYGANVRPEALARDAGALLAAGEPAAAFALIDRRCRLLVPTARDLFLRAQAHRAAGRFKAAQDDLESAISLDPGDATIDAAALDWGRPPQRAAAAARIAARATGTWRLRRKAVAALMAEGAPHAHRLTRTGRYVSGWVVWNGVAPFRIEMSGSATGVFSVEPDPGHPLAGAEVSAAEVAVEAPETGALRLLLTSPGGAQDTLALRDPAPRPPQDPPAAGALDGLTVIVPVYEDFEATRACLDSLARARAKFPCRALVVDDASPNPDLRDWLDARAAEDAFELTRNPINLGFAASVNLALGQCTGGDVLLLNADAVLPPDALARLHALARAEPGIGTLTPFSNNGELTSYPQRNIVNPLPSADEIDRRDALARAVNGDALVDLPNGIGFCLYITQACLASVGPLPEIYAEGYYEDVEFCLSARERGFRNVAAPGVFVGHAGSRSFTTRKNGLVMRNLALIEQRFPGYRLDTAAFVARDPLQPFRAALDAAEPPPLGVRLIVCGPGAAADLGRRRAQDAGEPALLLQFDPRGGATLTATGGGAPQSLRFAPESPALGEYLARAAPGRIEWFDPGAATETATSAILALGAPVDVLCGDLAWFAPPPTPPAGPCASVEGAEPCAACRDLAPSTAESERQRERRPRLARVLERAARIVPLDPLAESFARRVFKGRAAPFAGDAPSERPRRGRIATLGALYPRRSSAADRLLTRLARRLAAGDARLIVLGGAMDDAAILASGAAFVTGPIAAPDRAQAISDYGVDGLLAPGRSGGYADLMGLGLPQAWFDWSFGAFAAAPGDLALDPRICDDKAAARIEAWMEGMAN